VKRALVLCSCALGLAAAGTLSAVVVAEGGTFSATDTTSTSVTASSTTASSTTAPSTTAPSTTVSSTAASTTVATTTAVLPGRTVPADVRVGGVDVGGLTPAAAVAAVQASFAAPLPVVVGSSRLVLDPTQVATAYAALAVARARASEGPAAVTLTVNVSGSAVRSWVGRLAARFDRSSSDAALAFVHGVPRITPEQPGRRLAAAALTQALIASLQANSRRPVQARVVAVAPGVTAAKAFRAVIVINRSLNRLQLYTAPAGSGAKARPARLVRAFPVATGQAIYPTPKGTFHIVVKWKNPTWYPPTQDAWARGLKPVPPGPGNPLGTRWMGLSAPGVGIHGTDEPGSIGYSESHGCIRMQVPDAEWLFDHVDVGSTVFII